MVAGCVDRDHKCGQPNADNIHHWKAIAQTQKFCNYMLQGWNDALQGLTKANAQPSVAAAMDVGTVKRLEKMRRGKRLVRTRS